MSKEKTLIPVRPNLGIEAAYTKRLLALVDEMQASIDWWVKAAYKANTPEVAELATDASPARTLQAVIAKLGKRWQGKFDDEAPSLSRWFTESVQKRADGGMTNSLKTAGFSVKFNMTKAMNDVAQATIGENVGLIRSIASQHLMEVEGLVMRSVTAGRDVGNLAKELTERYDITRRRAELISKDQNNKMTANTTRVRQQELGITRAKWKHSKGGRHPRKSHLAADGEEYEISKGMYLDGVWTWPGCEIGCKCVSVALIRGFNA